MYVTYRTLVNISFIWWPPTILLSPYRTLYFNFAHTCLHKTHNPKYIDLSTRILLSIPSQKCCHASRDRLRLQWLPFGSKTLQFAAISWAPPQKCNDQPRFQSLTFPTLTWSRTSSHLLWTTFDVSVSSAPRTTDWRTCLCPALRWPISAHLSSTWELSLVQRSHSLIAHLLQNYTPVYVLHFLYPDNPSCLAISTSLSILVSVTVLLPKYLVDRTARPRVLQTELYLLCLQPFPKSVLPSSKLRTLSIRSYPMRQTMSQSCPYSPH